MATAALEQILDVNLGCFDDILGRLKGIKGSPTEWERAEAWVQKQNWTQALAAWTHLEKKYPHNLEITKNLAMIYMKMGNRAKADVLTNRVIRGYLDTHDISSAVVMANRMIEWFPNATIGHERLACLFHEIAQRHKGNHLGDHYAQQALIAKRRMLADPKLELATRHRLKWLMRVSKQDPRDLRTAREILALLTQTGQLEKAMKYVCTLADFLMARGHTDAVDQLIQIGRELDEEHPSIQFLIHLNAAHLGRPQQALRGLRELHIKTPENLDVMRAIALIETRFHNYDDAVYWWLKVFARDQDTAKSLVRIGKMMLDKGYIDATFRLYKALAFYHHNHGNVGVAIRLLSSVYRAAPEHVETIETLGLFYLYAGRMQDAYFFLDKSLGRLCREDPMSGCVLTRRLTHEYPNNAHLRNWHKKMKKAEKQYC